MENLCENCYTKHREYHEKKDSKMDYFLDSWKTGYTKKDNGENTGLF